MALEDVKFKCPSCGQTIEAPIGMVGMVVDCPTCSAKVTVAGAGICDMSAVPTSIKIVGASVALLVVLCVGIFLGGMKHLSDTNLSGVWELHMNKAVGELTIVEKDGIITGKIKTDAAFDGGEYDVRGLHSGADVELMYEAQFTSSTPGDSGAVNYTIKGTVNRASMGGSFTLLGPFSSSVSSPNEQSLWVANRK